MAKSFREQVLSNWKFSQFKLAKLPMAFIAGLKVVEINDERAVVTIKHNYVNKNPFKSLYFGSQAMAAELSTGVLVLEQVNNASVSISMLVGKMEATFTKKATGLIRFTCSDAAELNTVFQEAIESGSGKNIRMESVGTDESGDVVSTFAFEWAVRVRRPKK